MAETLCRWNGHHYVDDHSVTMDGAPGEVRFCTRCGEPHWHQYLDFMAQSEQDEQQIS